MYFIRAVSKVGLWKCLFSSIGRLLSRILPGSAGALLGLVLVLLVGVPATAVATGTPTGVISCSSCSSLTDLQTAAQNYLKTKGVAFNNGVILVTSLNEPVSAFFRVTVTFSCHGWLGCTYTATTTPITPDNAGTALIDNQIFARAAKVAPVKTPSNITHGEEDALISSWISSQFPVSGAPGFSVWHGLMNYPQFVYVTVVDAQTGKTVQIYVGDTITLDYGGGFTEQWKFLGPDAGSIQWQRVPNTYMKDGKPVTPPPPPPPAAPISGLGSINVTSPYQNGNLQEILGSICTGLAEVCIEDSCASNSYLIPC